MKNYKWKQIPFCLPFPIFFFKQCSNGFGHPGWVPPTGFRISPTPPGRRRPHHPHMACDHFLPAVLALPPCLQVPFRHSDVHLIGFHFVLILCCHPEFGLLTQAASRSMGAILIFALNVIFVSVFDSLSLLAHSYLLLPFLAPSV